MVIRQRRRGKILMRKINEFADYCDMYKESLSRSEILEYKQQAWHWYMLKQQRKTKLPIPLLSWIFGLIHPSQKY